MRVGSLIRQLQPKTFKFSYSPEYKTFIIHHVLTDPQHPLHGQRKQEYSRRSKEGLWWHVTSSVDLSKSSVVRNWCRRRLRNAVIEELKERGFDQYGRLAKPEVLLREWSALRSLKDSKHFNLTGSLRFHAQAPLISAQYTLVRQETGKVLDIALQAAAGEAPGAGQKHARAKIATSQWHMRATDLASKPSIKTQNRPKTRSKPLKPQ